jgi:hypothetical protein
VRVWAACPADRRQRMASQRGLIAWWSDASRRRLNNQELAPLRPPICDAADRDELLLFSEFCGGDGGSGHRSGSERQAMRQEGRGAVEARLFFWRGHAESSCTPE